MDRWVAAFGSQTSDSGTASLQSAVMLDLCSLSWTWPELAVSCSYPPISRVHWVMEITRAAEVGMCLIHHVETVGNQKYWKTTHLQGSPCLCVLDLQLCLGWMHFGFVLLWLWRWLSEGKPIFFIADWIIHFTVSSNKLLVSLGFLWSTPRKSRESLSQLSNWNVREET